MNRQKLIKSRVYNIDILIVYASFATRIARRRTSIGALVSAICKLTMENASSRTIPFDSSRQDGSNGLKEFCVIRPRSPENRRKALTTSTSRGLGEAIERIILESMVRS